MTLAEAQAQLAAVETAIHAKVTGTMAEEVSLPDGSKTRFAQTSLSDLRDQRSYLQQQITALGGTVAGSDNRPTVLFF
jgi:hypothetical protein